MFADLWLKSSTCIEPQQDFKAYPISTRNTNKSLQGWAGTANFIVCIGRTVEV